MDQLVQHTGCSKAELGVFLLGMLLQQMMDNDAVELILPEDYEERQDLIATDAKLPFSLVQPHWNKVSDLECVYYQYNLDHHLTN